MRKVILFFAAFVFFSFQFCATSRHGKNKKVARMTYVGHIEPIISTSCAPCHIPGKGNKTPLNTFASAKEEIDEIIERIQKNPSEKGFMPLKHAKLSADTIQMFTQWKADGLMEK